MASLYLDNSRAGSQMCSRRRGSRAKLSRLAGGPIALESAGCTVMCSSEREAEIPVRVDSNITVILHLD